MKTAPRSSATLPKRPLPKRPLLVLSLLTGLAIAPGAALAGTTPAADATGANSATKLALTRQLVSMTHGDAIMQEVTPQVLTPLLAQLKQMNPGHEQEVQAMADSELMPAVAKATRDLIPVIVNIYAEHYSEADLRAIIAFYQTPAGQRMIAAMPEIAAQTAQAGQEWGRQNLMGVIQTFLDACKAKGLSVGK